ncbi:MAG: PriCT-2 domain-containing protein [Selenomonadaceae bacterium]|nr:PriCT-2 domain-containing protein [Selenomonadaceae bacterium]
MIDSHDNKGSPNLQVPTDYQLPPRTYKGKLYYATADVAKIIGVTKQAVEKWRNKGWYQPDLQTDGVYLYEVERVYQLKSVYHPNWMRSWYQPAPTTTTDGFAQLPKENFDAEYLRLIKLDIEQAQTHLDNLPECDRRGLTLETLRHFGCGYLPNWILTKSRAEFACGLYVKELTDEPKTLPPPSERIIIPTTSMQHFNGVATSSARLKMNKDFWKQHAGTMELFADPDALNSDLIVVVEGEVDAMSIWQCSSGKIAAVAILGCGNWKRTLLPKLNDLRGKRLILLLDADAAGKKSANKLLNELLNRGCLAVTKYLYDALPKDEQNFFGWKVDANSILTTRGDTYLNQILRKIIANAEPDFKALEERIAQQNIFLQEQAVQHSPELSLPKQKKSSTPSATDENVNRNEIKHILKDFVHAKNLTRDDWCTVGMILRRYDFSLEDFQAWSKDDSRYSSETCATQWKSFKSVEELQDKGYKIGTLIEIAKRFGYQSKPSAQTADSQNFNSNDFMQDPVEDLDNARRLEKFCGEHIRWLIDDELWLTFNNGIWSRRSEKSSCLYPFATQFADQMMNFAKILGAKADEATKAAVITSGDGSIQRVDELAKKKADIAQVRKDKAFTIAYYFKKRKNYSAAIDLLKGCDSILITSDDLNRHKNLFCVKNGVVDLQTGKLYPLDPKYLITNQADVFFYLNADTAFVEKFFHEVIPDEATLLGVLRYLGYCLTGEKIYHICQFWRGRGANGKTTILDMLIQLLGSYAIKLPTNALLESMRPMDANAASPALAMLDGDIRLAILDEIPRNCRLDATTFKTIIGDQFITARPLYGNPRKIELRAKLILNGNHLPNFDVDDGGLQRRINNVEYTQIFSPDRADVTLPAKLTTPENRSALLKILVSHSQDFYRNGLIESDDMKAAKAEYFNENDFVASFVDEYCIIGEGGEIKRKDFEARLISNYPSETSRLKKKDLFRIITERLNFLGSAYMKAHGNQNVFKNIHWA